jgi:hypothetical protein
VVTDGGGPYFACQAGDPTEMQATDAPASLDHILESTLQLLKKGHNIDGPVRLC